MAPRPDDPDDGVPSQGADAPPPADDAAVPPSDDEVWQSIVAQLADLDDTAEAAAVEPEPAPALDFPVAPWVAETRVVRPAQDESGRDWDGSAQFDSAEAEVDGEEHFVPPDPGPALGRDPLLTMAWFAAAGMPLLLLILLVAWPAVPAALVQAAGVVFLLGVGVLVWRMPNRRDPSDDDSGAVV